MSPMTAPSPKTEAGTRKFKVEITATRTFEITVDGTLDLRDGEEPEDAVLDVAAEVAVDNLFRSPLENGVKEIDGWDVQIEAITEIGASS